MPIVCVVDRSVGGWSDVVGSVSGGTCCPIDYRLACYLSYCLGRGCNYAAMHPDKTGRLYCSAQGELDRVPHPKDMGSGMQHCSFPLVYSLLASMIVGRTQYFMHCSSGPPSDGQPLVWGTAALTGLQLPGLRQLLRTISVSAS